MALRGHGVTDLPEHSTTAEVFLLGGGGSKAAPTTGSTHLASGSPGAPGVTQEASGGRTAPAVPGRGTVILGAPAPEKRPQDRRGGRGLRRAQLLAPARAVVAVQHQVEATRALSRENAARTLGGRCSSCSSGGEGLFLTLHSTPPTRKRPHSLARGPGSPAPGSHVINDVLELAPLLPAPGPPTPSHVPSVRNTFGPKQPDPGGLGQGDRPAGPSALEPPQPKSHPGPVSRCSSGSLGEMKMRVVAQFKRMVNLKQEPMKKTIVHEGTSGHYTWENNNRNNPPIRKSLGSIM
ncbi:uncharacterized protein [Notamacropus eugenii]|uniref:uncharacterized protein n=1 Tax=Notamacropus eugenii TaxID=9315 RepID=UPI003B677B60